MSDVHVLANPAARQGRGARHLAEALAGLRAHGASCTEVATTSAASARDAIRDIVAAAPQARLVLVGGDGLVHLALQEIAGRDASIGILPAGTGNDFAHALGLDRGDLAAQIARALAAPVALDAIRTDREWVASVATLGFAARVNARANARAWPRGRARYSVATVAELPSLRAVSVELELDDRRLEVDTTLLAVANTAYFGGGMQICPAARPDDGLLDVAVIGDVGRTTLLRVFPQVFRGTHVDHPKVTVHRAARVRIARTTEDVWGDGEPLGPAPLELRAVPGALHVAGAS